MIEKMNCVLDDKGLVAGKSASGESSDIDDIVEMSVDLMSGASDRARSDIGGGDGR